MVTAFLDECLQDHESPDEEETWEVTDNLQFEEDKLLDVSFNWASLACESKGMHISGGWGGGNLTPYPSIYNFDRKGTRFIYHPLKNGKSTSLNQKVFQSFLCNVNRLKWYGYNLWPSCIHRFSYTFKYLKSWIHYPLIHLKPPPPYPFGH